MIMMEYYITISNDEYESLSMHEKEYTEKHLVNKAEYEIGWIS